MLGRGMAQPLLLVLDAVKARGIHRDGTRRISLDRGNVRGHRLCGEGEIADRNEGGEQAYSR